MGEPQDELKSQLLRRLAGGEVGVEEELFALLYEDLRSHAHRLMRHQSPSHTLQSTALVHEAWIKFSDRGLADVTSRTHFFRLASRAMRSVLIDHARARGAQKRGEGRSAIEIEDAGVSIETTTGDILDLDDALHKLAALDGPAASVAELRLFGGLEHPEIASILGASTRTIERHWRFARAWLQHALNSGGDAANEP